MRADALRTGAALLGAALVLAYAAFAWREAERRSFAAAEAQARAVASALAAGVDTSLAAGAALEDVLAERLTDLADGAAARLAERPGAEQRTLEAFCRAHRIRGAVLLADDYSVRAVASGRPPPPAPGADGPFDAARLLALEAESLAARVRAAGLAERGRVVIGFGESPFGRRTEFLVGVRADACAGLLLLRQDADDLQRFEREAGLARVLADAVAAPGLAYLAVQAEDGTVLAAAGDDAALGASPPVVGRATWRAVPDAARVLDVAVPAAWKGADGAVVRIGFAAAPVASVVDDARRSVVLFTALVLVFGAAGAALLGVRERRARAREALLRADLEKRERLAALGRLAGGFAHEVRGPLNALSMAAQRLRREGAPEDAERRARAEALHGVLREEVRRVDAAVQEFLALGREPPPAQPAAFDVGALVREVAERECPSARPAGPDATAHADRALVARALANVLRNARESAPPGTVDVTWRAVGGDVEIVVDDGGPGIDATERDALFEPFHSRREGGTGLGLHLARDALARTGGTITCAAAPSGGARFAIRLPGPRPGGTA